MTRGSPPDIVRNPVLALPSAQRILKQPTERRTELAILLRELSADARQRAQKCWRQNKGPMAVYWKAVGAYSTHLHRVVRPKPKTHQHLKHEASMPKTIWIIDWHIQGSTEIKAENADRAQELFDERFGTPRYLDPLRDGEISNDPPYRKSTQKRPGGRGADQT